MKLEILILVTSGDFGFFPDKEDDAPDVDAVSWKRINKIYLHGYMRKHMGVKLIIGMSSFIFTWVAAAWISLWASGATKTWTHIQGDTQLPSQGFY